MIYSLLRAIHCNGRLNCYDRLTYHICKLKSLYYLHSNQHGFYSSSAENLKQEFGNTLPKIKQNILMKHMSQYKTLITPKFTHKSRLPLRWTLFANSSAKRVASLKYIRTFIAAIWIFTNHLMCSFVEKHRKFFVWADTLTARGRREFVLHTKEALLSKSTRVCHGCCNNRPNE